MMQAVRRAAATLNPVRARAKVLARENREMRFALVRMRHEKGLTQQDVAEMLGVTQQAVQKMERYDADLKLSTVERYANAVGALVHHQVVVDRGQSTRLAQPSAWGATGSSVRHSVQRTTHRAVGSINGWQTSRAIGPEVIVVERA